MLLTSHSIQGKEDGLERSIMGLVQLFNPLSDTFGQPDMEGCALAPGLLQPEAPVGPRLDWSKGGQES